MKAHDRERLAQKLAALDMNERNRIYKRAAKLRKEDQRRRRKPTVRKRNWSEDDDGARTARTRSGLRSLQNWALEVLARDEIEAGEWTEGPPDGPSTAAATVSGLVVHVEREHCDVLVDGAVIACALAPMPRSSGLVVGDRVLLTRGAERSLVRAVLPRRSVLERTDPQNPHRTRVVVANVDRVVVVVSLAQPPLRTGMIDRYLIACARGGAQAMLCANKADLCDGDERASELAKLAPYVERGVEVRTVSAATGEGVQALRDALAGRVSAFVGKSGVGKSSLMNALLPGLALATSEVRAKDGKGRHTTTSSTLYELPGGGAVLDTPGIRSLGLASIDAAELALHFPELAPFAERCRYRDCRHLDEPSCGVREAVARGELDEARWRAYQRILE